MLTFLALSGIVIGYLAVRLGKWRHLNIFMEMKAPYNTAESWRSGPFQKVSGLMVALLSILSASLLAYVIGAWTFPLLGKFSWGALLLARYLASAILGNLEGQKELGEDSIG